MDVRRWVPRPVPVAALVLTLALAVSGCGSGSSSSTTSPAPTLPPSSTPTGTTGGTAATVRRTFEQFFSGSTDADRKISLVQHGSEFADVIHQQAGGTLARSTSVKVLQVHLTAPWAAAVRYTIYLGGQPALKNQNGVAVKESGTWKVSAPTFCSLLTLEGSAPPLCSRTS